MPHREDIREYLEGLTIEGKVIDWGAGSKPIMKYVQVHRAEFKTIDKNSQSNPDILHDITKPIKIYQADHAFCMEVLEHVTEPSGVIDNIYVNLKEGGQVHISVPSISYAEHGEDYWRFTKRGLEYLLTKANFEGIKIMDITDGYIVEATK